LGAEHAFLGTTLGVEDLLRGTLHTRRLTGRPRDALSCLAWHTAWHVSGDGPSL
ncbi:hypothetical protein HAX54_032462, partial [Datura stramonium]|nr:hypothetical protein [Datura stramonium]